DGAGGKPDQRKAHMADRRIGHQALDVGLADRGERAQRHRGDRHEHQDLLPLADDARECGQRRTGEHRERGDLRSGREECRHRRRRSLIDVGRPHVERHRRDLEAEPGEQEHQAEHDADAAGGGGGRDAGERDRAGETVDQRSTVQQHARRQRAEHEILQAGLARLGIVALAGGNDIERKAHQLEAEVERDQVAGRDQYHHAERREQHQDRELEGTARRLGQVLGRQD
ncbi:hypothetical protein chiPu_0029552, partial [Chiloscyllium punctatum]|nr:hypothetical protein [Chiloscyllium punctatum]